MSAVKFSGHDRATPRRVLLLAGGLLATLHGAPVAAQSVAPAGKQASPPAAWSSGPAQPARAPAPQSAPPTGSSPLPPPAAASLAAPATPPATYVAAAAPSYGARDDRATEHGAEPARTQPQCAIGGFCIGPVVTAGALNVFGIGAHARMDYWGFGVDYQFIGLSYEDVDGQLGLLTIEGRVYPFANAFYLAGGLAWQSVALDTVVHVPAMQGLPAMDVRAKGSVDLPLFKLGIGFMGREGFVLGIDLGFGIRLSGVDVNVETDLPRIAEVIEAENEFRAAAEQWIEWLPFTLQLNVIRIGYLF